MSAEPISRQERKERTRRALLDGALHLLAERTLAGVSLRELTKEAGIVPTAFYRHFTSMDELGTALVHESMRTLRAMMRQARLNRPAGGDTIADSVRVLHEHVRAKEDHFRFLIRERYAGHGPVRASITTELRLFAGDLAIDLGRIEAVREWSSQDVRMMADLIVTAMLGTVTELLEADGLGHESDAEILESARKRLRLIVLGVAGWRSPS